MLKVKWEESHPQCFSVQAESVAIKVSVRLFYQIESVLQNDVCKIRRMFCKDIMGEKYIEWFCTFRKALNSVAECGQ